MIGGSEDSNQTVEMHSSSEGFYAVIDVIEEAIQLYISNKNSEEANKFYQDIKCYLKNFANGVEPDIEFDFRFSYRSSQGDNSKMNYINFYLGSSYIEIDSGGSLYDKHIGSDSYSSWTYTIDIDGWSDGDFYFQPNILGLINHGAELIIESPDEYYNLENE